MAVELFGFSIGRVDKDEKRKQSPKLKTAQLKLAQQEVHTVRM
jgi:hypothetical protein